MTEENKKKTLEKIATINDAGGTDINMGMTHAFNILKQRRIKNTVSSIFLLSDGLDGGAQEKVKSTMEAYGIKDTFSLHTFGFGNDHDPKLMTDIADLKDGNFYYIEKLDTVDEAFVDCLGGLLSAVAQNVMIKINTENQEVIKGVEITKAFGDASMWIKEGKSYITRINNLITGKEKDYVLELKIPKIAKDLADNEKQVKLVSVTVTLEDFKGKSYKFNADLNLQIVNETEECKDEADDKDVLTNFYRVRGGEVLTEAKGMADQRKYDDAQKLLKNFQEELSGSVIKEEQFVKNLMKDIKQAMEDTKPQVYEERGKLNMIGNARAQMQQKSYLQSANCYSNEVQQQMVFETKMKKAK